MSRVVLHRLVRLNLSSTLESASRSTTRRSQCQTRSRKARETRSRIRYTPHRRTYPAILSEYLSTQAGVSEAPLSSFSAVALKNTSAIPQASTNEALTSVSAIHQTARQRALHMITNQRAAALIQRRMHPALPPTCSITFDHYLSGVIQEPNVN